MIHEGKTFFLVYFQNKVLPFYLTIRIASQHQHCGQICVILRLRNWERTNFRLDIKLPSYIDLIERKKTYSIFFYISHFVVPRTLNQDTLSQYRSFSLVQFMCFKNRTLSILNKEVNITLIWRLRIAFVKFNRTSWW